MSLPSSSMSWRQPTPMMRRISPTVSMGFLAVAVSRPAMGMRSATRHTAPTGTLTKKIQFHV